MAQGSNPSYPKVLTEDPEEYIQEISEHGIFHGVTDYQENKPLNIKDKKGLFTIQWNDSTSGTGRHLPAVNRKRPVNPSCQSRALGRKSGLFAGSQRSGQCAATIMNLVQSAKVGGLVPQAPTNHP